MIKATVTVKGEPYTLPVYPAETHAGIWNEYKTQDGRIKLTFPSLPDKLTEDSEPLGNGQSLITVGANTRHGRYRVLARPFDSLIENRDIDLILENSIKSSYSGPDVKVLQKRNVFYDGVVGKEFVAVLKRAEGEHVQYIRSFLLDSRMIILIVEIDDRSSEEKMKPWIQRFFDSLTVPRLATKDA